MARKQRTGNFKLKTYKAAAKRFRMTGSGKLMRTKGPKSHLRRKKSERSKDQFIEMKEVVAPGHQAASQAADPLPQAL